MQKPGRKYQTGMAGERSIKIFGIRAPFLRFGNLRSKFPNRKKPGFPLQVLGFAHANPVGFPLQSLAQRQLSIKSRNCHGQFPA
jgi:hypothetical protein